MIPGMLNRAASQKGVAPTNGGLKWKSFDERRVEIVRRLRAIPGVACREPLGAFYAFPDLSAFIGRRTPSGTAIADDAALCGFLLWVQKRYRLAAGRLLGVYLIGYGIGRFWIEGLRIDPSHEVAGLRWNQWVALAAIAAGAIYLFVTRGKKWDETPRAAIVDGVEGAIDGVDPVERSTEP